MSDSRRTDTRSFSKVLPLLLSLLLSLGWLLPKASAANEPVAESPTPSAGLFDNLSTLNLTALLGSVLPNEIILVAGLDKNPLATALFDLVQYMRNNTDPRTADEILAELPKYRRLDLFGTWVNEDAPKNCYDTRTEVLLRDAVPGAPVTFNSAYPCKVARAEWSDPYSGTTYKLVSAIQIDHVVPLQNAYRSGAHAWSRERRCHYSNYLEDHKHLLAVSAHENMSKGARGPEDYLPPDSNYVCAYVANWMRIKAAWALQFTALEKTAIETTLRDHACDVKSTQLTLNDIQRSRAGSMRTNVKCVDPLAP